MKFLLEHGADANAEFTWGVNVTATMTPLLYAVNYGKEVDVVKALLSHGADVNEKWGGTKNYGIHKISECSPLHLAILHDFGYSAADKVKKVERMAKTIEALIEHGADVNAKDEFGMTPLHHILLNDSLNSFEKTFIEILKLLLENGADVNEEFGSDSISPLAYTIKSNYNMGKVEAVKLLLKHGADVKARTKGLDNWTPLHAAVIMPYPPKMNAEVTKIILKQGGNVNAKGKLPYREDGMPLHYAVTWEGNGIDVLEVLLDYGADVNVANSNKDTPLHRCLKEKSPDISVIKWLINNGAKVNVENKTGETPLSLAKSDTIRSYLIENGAKH